MTAFAIRTRGHLLIERNVLVYRHAWMTIFSGFFEPLFYLFSIGIGLGHFVGQIHGVSYASYVAPALLASSAMNGALNDALTNVFWKLRYMKVYESVLATPLGPGDVAVGETIWAQMRGILYSVGFLVTVAAFGLIHSWWALFSLPAAMLIGFSFAGMGIGASTFVRTWQDLEIVQIVQLPMFLFSGTFYPLSVYPAALQWLVRVSPLYHAIALIRAFTLGHAAPVNVLNAAYLLALGLVGLWIARRRMGRLLLT